MSAVLSPVPIAADALERAVQVYLQAKRTEAAATKARVEAEERILALHPAREEGSETFEAAGFKITLTGKLSYGCKDVAALAATCVGLGWPENLVPVKTKTELDATGAKWLRANEPGMWAQIAPHLVVKPAKTSVEVKA